MGFFTPNQQVDNFQTKVDSCTRPLAGQQFYPCIPDDALVQPLFGGNFVFQRREAGHITNREDIVRHQHGGWRGANSRDDTPGTVELFNGFNQQSAIAKTLRAFNATRQHDHVIFAISHFDQRRIRQQLHAARAGNRQVTIAGDAGSGDFDTAANQQIDSGDGFSLFTTRGEANQCRCAHIHSPFFLPFQTGGCFPVRQSHARGRGVRENH